MKNPFEDLKALNFAAFLRELIKDKKSGDVFYLDARDYKKPHCTLRATLRRISNKKFSTIIDKEDKNIIWVKVL